MQTSWTCTSILGQMFLGCLLPFPGAARLPRVVLIGDSVRGGYQPVVERRLEGLAEIVGPGGSTTGSVLENLSAWLIARDPDVIHINCGLHDCAIEKTGELRVPLEEYRKNLEAIFGRLRRDTRARIIWATTTPINWEREVLVPPRLMRRDSDVRAYNAASVEIARRFGVEINDLYGVVTSAGRDTQLGGDGIHFTEAGYELIGTVVAEAIRARLPR
jgi:lysophospholipase L1-like esterase